jgi:hypothetical protein
MARLALLCGLRAMGTAENAPPRLVRFRQRLLGDCLQRPDAPPLGVGGAPGRTRGLKGDLIGNQASELAGHQAPEPLRRSG